MRAKAGLKHGMSQQELADACDLDITGGIERGQVNPTLGVTPDSGGTLVEPAIL